MQFADYSVWLSRRFSDRHNHFCKLDSGTGKIYEMGKTGKRGRLDFFFFCRCRRHLVSVKNYMKEEKDMPSKKETAQPQMAEGAVLPAKFDFAVPHLWLPMAFRVEKDSMGSRLVRLVIRRKKQQGSVSTTVSPE